MHISEAPGCLNGVLLFSRHSSACFVCSNAGPLVGCLLVYARTQGKAVEINILQNKEVSRYIDDSNVTE